MIRWALTGTISLSYLKVELDVCQISFRVNSHWLGDIPIPSCLQIWDPCNQRQTPHMVGATQLFPLLDVSGHGHGTPKLGLDLLWLVGIRHAQYSVERKCILFIKFVKFAKISGEFLIHELRALFVIWFSIS